MSRLGRAGRGYRIWVGGPVPRQADAITLGRLIVVRRRSFQSPNFPQLLRHELTHVEQWNRVGYALFAYRYVKEYLDGRRSGLAHHHAYLAISFEEEARRHACLPHVATIGGMTTSEVSLEQLSAAHERLNMFVSSLTEADLRSPSRLPDWSVGHVVAHMAMNALAFEAVALAAMANEPAFMYESMAARNANIESNATHSAEQMKALVTQANLKFEAAWTDLVRRPDRAALFEQVAAATTGGSPAFSLDTIPLRRLREVEVHSIDCGVRSRTIDGWSDTFVEADLVTQFATVSRRTQEPVHVIDEHGAHFATSGAEQNDAVHLPRRHLLAWALDRATPDGLPTLAPWGNQSAWEPER
jgi:maleylpyruvate isomerase